MGPVVPSQICQVLRRIYRGCRYAAVGTHTHTGVTCTLAPLYISPLRPCYGKFTGCDGKCMEFPWDINRKKKNFNMTSNHVTLSYMLTGTGGTNVHGVLFKLLHRSTRDFTCLQLYSDVRQYSNTTLVLWFLPPIYSIRHENSMHRIHLANNKRIQYIGRKMHMYPYCTCLKNTLKG